LEITGKKMGKRERGKAYADRAMVDLETYLHGKPKSVLN
jgi:hypothetical protein